MLTCADFDLILAEVLHRADLPGAAQEHLAECGPCTALLNDIETIAESVRQLPMEPREPVPNLWPQIRAALREEGVIHTDGRECGRAPLMLVHRSK